jgi:hypothetical protein
VLDAADGSGVDDAYSIVAVLVHDLDRALDIARITAEQQRREVV